MVVENLCTPFRELVWSERKIWGLSERKPLCALILVLRDVFEVRVTNFKNQENFVENGNLARFVLNLHLYLPCWSFHFSWSLFLFLYCFCSYRYINFYLPSALFPRNVRIFHKVFLQRKGALKAVSHESWVLFFRPIFSYSEKRLGRASSWHKNEYTITV